MSDGGRSSVRYVYPTISPQVVVIPIVSCIVVFPILVLIIICALRYRAMRARRFEKLTRGRRMGLTGGDTGARGTPMEVYNDGRPFVQCRNGKRKTIVRFKPMPELDLDTVVEERSEFDAEVNALELLQAPQDPTKLCVLNHPVSFRSFRFGYGASGQPIKKKNSYGRPIGSPKPKRAKTPDDLFIDQQDNEKTEKSQKTTSDVSPGRRSPSLVLAMPLLTTDVDDEPVRSDHSSPNCHAEVLLRESTDIIAGNCMSDEGKVDKASFVIPSVSVQAFLDDSSDDSLSYIDKSEEVQFVNECSDSGTVRMSTVGYQAKTSTKSADCEFQTKNMTDELADNTPLVTSVLLSTSMTYADQSQYYLQNFQNGNTNVNDNLNSEELSSCSKNDSAGTNGLSIPQTVECAVNSNKIQEETYDLSLSSSEKSFSVNGTHVSREAVLKDNALCVSNNNYSRGEITQSIKEEERSCKSDFKCTTTCSPRTTTTLERNVETTTEPNTPSIFSKKWGKNPYKPTHLDDPLDYRQNMLLMRSRSAADVITSTGKKNSCSFSVYKASGVRNETHSQDSDSGMLFKGNSLDGSLGGLKIASHSCGSDFNVQFSCPPKLDRKLEEFKDSFGFRSSLYSCSVEFAESDEPSDGAEV